MIVSAWKTVCCTISGVFLKSPNRSGIGRAFRDRHTTHLKSRWVFEALSLASGSMGDATQAPAHPHLTSHTWF